MGTVLAGILLAAIAFLGITRTRSKTARLIVIVAVLTFAYNLWLNTAPSPSSPTTFKMEITFSK